MHKYLLLDRGTLVGHKMTNAKIEVNQIVKDSIHNPLFREGYFDIPPKKWELRYDNGYPNVIYDEDKKLYRCYYTLFTYDESSAAASLSERKNLIYKPRGNRITSLCYAESRDGIHFEKPDLGLVQFEGDCHNNILIRYAHGSGIFLDKAEADPKKRYKLVTKVEYSESRHYMAVGFSEDGIHFGRLIEWPQFNPAGDSHNFPFRDPKTGKFVVITRIWKNGVRICAKSESADFINWSEPEEILRGQGFENQIYSMPVIAYGNLYLGFASMYHEGDTNDENFDTVEVELKYAARLNGWDSVAWGQKLIPRGRGSYPAGEFDCGCVYSAAPVEAEGKLWFYYMGGNGFHTGFRETSFARGYLEKDKFAGYIPKNDREEAVLTTSHFVVYGDYLSVLADVEPGGGLSVALGTKGGAVYDGYEAEQCVLKKQGDGYYLISFKNKKITELQTSPVSIHIHFKKAKVYALYGELENYMLKY